MASSSNRFDVLEESSSRSDEQKRTLDREKTDGVEGRSCLAANGDDELQQASSPTLESGSRSPNLRVRESAVTLPTNVSDSESEQTLSDSEPEQTLSDDEAEEVDFPPILSDAPFLSISRRWLNTGDIQNPGTPLFCIAQANNEPLIGSFSAVTEQCTLRLTIDAGPLDPPRLEMDLFCDGTDGPLTGSTGWWLSDFMRGEFRVSEIKFYRLADCASYVDVATPDVLAACETDDERNRLICVSLRTAQTPGPLWDEIPEGYDESVRNLLSILFVSRRRYNLRIWFIAPYDLDDLEERCFAFFILAMERRRRPLYLWFQAIEEEAQRANRPSQPEGSGAS